MKLCQAKCLGSRSPGRGAGRTGEGRVRARAQTSAVPTIWSYFGEKRFRAFSKGLGLSISANQVGTALEKPDADRKVFLRVFLELGQELSQRLGTGAQVIVEGRVGRKFSDRPLALLNARRHDVQPIQGVVQAVVGLRGGRELPGRPLALIHVVAHLVAVPD